VDLGEPDRVIERGGPDHGSVGAALLVEEDVELPLSALR
jgi:hypothetical protein